MSDYARRRLACDLADVSGQLKAAAYFVPVGGHPIESIGFKWARSAAHAAIRIAIDRGNAAEDDRMESTLDIAAGLLDQLARERSSIRPIFDPTEARLLIEKIRHLANEIEEGRKTIERELSSMQTTTPVVSEMEDESVSPFDHFGVKTRKLLNYLWDRGRKPPRLFDSVMKLLRYRISSESDKKAFRQLKNRANDELSKMPEKPRYIIETNKKEKNIFLAELPS